MTHWKPVPGWEALYEVSDTGEVRSLDRQMKNRWGSTTLKPGRVLRQVEHRGGYMAVRLQEALSKRDKTVKVHTLVLEAFAGPKPEGMEARHLNGNSRDNRSVNLTWGTRSENNLDRVAHGTHQHTRKTHCPQGHEYDYIDPTGGRRCKTCRRKQFQKFKERQKSNGSVS